jgi:hypothetical protein
MIGVYMLSSKIVPSEMILLPGTLILIETKTSSMSSHTVEIGENTRHISETPPEPSHWSVKYNRSLDEIQHIFNNCGNSIARTIEILRREIESINRTGQPS